MAAAATRAHAVRATDGGAEQRLRGARDGRRGGAATAPAVAAPSVPETCALVQGACQEGGKRGGAGRAAAAASSRALRAQWGGRARAQRVTGQGSSPHPAVAFERRLSHACAGAAGRSAVGRDGAVPAAGRVQGAGAENPAHSAPAEAADEVGIGQLKLSTRETSKKASTIALHGHGRGFCTERSYFRSNETVDR